VTLFDWIAAVSGAWIVLACVSGTGWALVAAHTKRRARPTVVRAHYPPPVPAPRTPPLSQTVAPACLFDGIPSDCLSDDAIHSLFDDVVRGGFA
jgi:hypothetical protein